MEKLISNIKQSFLYFEKQFMVYFFLYIVSIILGIIINFNQYDIINEVSLSFWNIFAQNLRLSLILIIVGFFTFGIISALVLIFNGFILGYVLIVIYNSYGILPILTGIMPHFFLEMIALILACCISRESHKFIYNMRYSTVKTIRIRNSFYTFMVMLILLILASGIESSIPIQY